MTGQENTLADHDLTKLYRETILVHSANPVGYQSDIKATHSNEQYNPLCGDRISIRLQVVGDHIHAAAFDGAACAICMASASILCAQVNGQHVSLIRSAHDGLQQALKTEEDVEVPDFLQALLAVRRYPSRVSCALLPWIAAVTALDG